MENKNWKYLNLQMLKEEYYFTKIEQPENTRLLFEMFDRIEQLEWDEVNSKYNRR